jgi:hypothetical protein
MLLIFKICASERLTLVLKKAAFPDRRHIPIPLKGQFLSLLLPSEKIHAKVKNFRF